MIVSGVRSQGWGGSWGIREWKSREAVVGLAWMELCMNFWLGHVHILKYHALLACWMDCWRKWWRQVDWESTSSALRFMSALIAFAIREASSLEIVAETCRFWLSKSCLYFVCITSLDASQSRTSVIPWLISKLPTINKEEIGTGQFMRHFCLHLKTLHRMDLHHAVLNCDGGSLRTRFALCFHSLPWDSLKLGDSRCALSHWSRRGPEAWTLEVSSMRRGNPTSHVGYLTVQPIPCNIMADTLHPFQICNFGVRLKCDLGCRFWSGLNFSSCELLDTGECKCWIINL